VILRDLLDNTVIFNFRLVKQAELLFQLWPGKVCTTEERMNEYRMGLLAVGVPREIWKALPIVTLTEVEKAWMVNLPPYLGAGEATCLATALHRKGVFASDDRKARTFVQSLNIPVIGTVGILLRFVEGSLLSIKEVQGLLDQMIAARYRSPIQNLSEFS